MSDLELARSLLNEGEIRPALEVIDNYITGITHNDKSSHITSYRDAVTLLLSRFARNNKDYMNGTVSIEDRATVDSQIIARALILLSSFNSRIVSAQPKPNKLPDENFSEKITSSQSHLRQTGWIAKGLSVSTCVCRLRSDKKLGTGFLINDDIIVTNHHIIENKEESESFIAEFFYEQDENGLERHIRRIKFDAQRVFVTSTALDLTVVALASNPGDDIYRAETNRGMLPGVGDHVNIIQHPSGGYKQLAITNNLVVNIYDSFVQYMTDTLPGSSGSPVFDDSWRLVAVHHAGGNIIKSSSGERFFANEGALICKAREDPAFKSLLS